MYRVLAVLVNYGTEQLEYLQQVVNELNSFDKYNVTVIVNSNIPLDSIYGIDRVNIIQLEDYEYLPQTCKRTMWKYKDDFDLFLYGENDHLFKEHHLDKYLEYTDILPDDRIAGLIQYEENETGRYYPAYHLHYEWEDGSVEEYDGRLFAHFKNLHQATFILTKEQLHRIGELQNGFFHFFGLSEYSMKCKVNTDIYQFCDMKKLICISEFEDNLIHHLPNVYINGSKGRRQYNSGEDKMMNRINELIESYDKI